jgi:hypothetical protein
VRVFVWSGCLRLERSEQQARGGDACLLTTTGCQRNAPRVVAQLIVARVNSTEVTKPHSPTQQVKKSRKSSTPLIRGGLNLGLERWLRPRGRDSVFLCPAWAFSASISV